MLFKIDKNLINKKFLLCVSGGADSMVMLHNFLLQMDKSNLAVITVNHNLREAGASDAQFVFDYCAQKDVRCIVKSVDAAEFAKSKKLSVETAARQLRYQAILEESDGFDFVCLAHHSDDNAETVLLHMLRGGGLRGAAGIRTFNGKFFRPLLSVTRQQIAQYAEQNNIPFVTDETNALCDCKRNFLRHKVFPQLQKINDKATEALNNFALLAAEDDEYLNSLADISEVRFENDRAVLPIKLLNQPKPIAARVLFKVFRSLGAVKDIENKHINDIIKMCEGNFGTKTIDLPFSFEAVREYDILKLVKKNVSQPISEEIPLKIGKISVGMDTVYITKEPPKNNTEKVLTADWDKIPQSAILRTRRDGDIFTKYGGGTKKLKDFLIDKKIPLLSRDKLILIADRKEILAILGVEISDKIKIDANTKTTVYFYK